MNELSTNYLQLVLILKLLKYNVVSITTFFLGVIMKRRYKLLLIIVIGAALTILINFITVKSLVNLVSIGDGFSLGMTPYNVAGPSFNDYLKDKLENKNKLDSYNNEFSKAHLTIHELNEYMEDNTLGKFTRNPIKQTIASADIITLSIGLDEFADLSLQNNLTTEKMENYISEVEKFLQTIREFYDKKIIIIGLYPAYKFDQSDAYEINNNLKKLAGKYNCQFLDITAYYLNDEYYLDKTSYYLNYKAHQLIAENLFTMLN